MANLTRIAHDLDELQAKKKEFIKKYNGELPEYLQEYFDTLENNLEKDELYKSGVYHRKRFITPEKKEAAEKKFWEENELKVISKRNPKDEYSESIGRELLEEERLRGIDTKHIISACSSRLDAFAKFYFPHFLRKPSSELHKFLYKTLSRELNKKDKPGYRGARWAIAAPRANAKSTLVSCIFPLWCIVYNKKKFIIILSDTAGQAKDFLSDIRRELESNVRLQRDFPHACGKGDTWRIEEIITRNDTKVLALGSGNKIRGRRFGVSRPDLLVLDDTENIDIVSSDTERTNLKTWFNKDVMFVGGEAGTRVDIFVVGTILGTDSLLNSLLDPVQYPNFKTKKFKAVKKFSSSPLWDEWETLYKNPLDKERENTARKFFEEHEQKMLRGTKVLWPEGDPYYDLMINKLVDPSGFESEKQNSSIDFSLVKVHENELHFEDFTKLEMRTILAKCDFYGALDPSLGKNVKTGDYASMVVLGKSSETGKLYVPKIMMKRTPPEKQINAICNAYEKFMFRIFGVETNAFQIILLKLLKAESNRRGGLLIPVKEIKNYSDKIMRLESLFPLIKDGTIVFDSHSYEFNKEYHSAIMQLISYTGKKNEHDDFMDALEMCVRIIRGKVFRRIAKPTNHRGRLR